MRPLRSYRLSALVLRSRNLGEADRLLTLLSSEKGKITAVAKGARKPRSKLASLQLFSLASLQLAVGKSLDLITQASVHLSFPSLRTDVSRFTYASYFAELADGFSEEEQKNRRLFDLLIAALAHLEKSGEAEISPEMSMEMLAREFEMRLLDISGYGPEIQLCAACAQPLAAPAFRFSPGLGGLLCPVCSRQTASLPLLHDEVRYWLLALRRRRSILPKTEIPLTPRGRKELQYFLRSQVEYHLERKPKSLKLLDKLAAGVSHDQR